MRSAAADRTSAAADDPYVIGAVDVRSAAALLIGALPIVVWLRRHPPRLSDVAHAWAYVALLIISALAMVLSPGVLSPDFT